MPVRDVDGDELGRQVFSGELINRGAVRGFDTQGDGGVNALAVHVAHELDIVQIEAVHHIKVIVFRHPQTDLLIDDCFHVGRHHGQAELVATEFDAGVAF